VLRTNRVFVALGVRYEAQGSWRRHGVARVVGDWAGALGVADGGVGSGAAKIAPRRKCRLRG